jgi:hypothetical protein
MNTAGKGGTQICVMCFRIVTYVLPVRDRAFIIKRLDVMISHLNLTWGLHSCQEIAEECSYCFMVSHTRESVEIALGIAASATSRTT